jgi:hypothetical protein
LHGLAGKSVYEKLGEELKSLVGSCEIPHVPKKPVDHAFPYFEASIDSCGYCTLNQADGIVEQHLVLADRHTDRD